ncbi:MAG: type VI secretion system baseplate subunit TssG [Acidobacteriota bacterium]
MARKPLNQQLFDEPYGFEFFQAVRLLEKAFPERRPVGREALPNQEVVRFRSRISLDFPPSEVYEIKETVDPQTEETRTEMIVTFMGMVGVSGILPTHYTELVLDRIRQRDTAMWAFLDIFTHRAVSMFYRAWGKYRFPIGYEHGNDDFTSYLFDIGGLGTAGIRGKMGVEDESLLPYAGLIAQKPHSTNAIQNVLSDYFRVPVAILQFFGQWLELDSADFTKLGVDNSLLGSSAIIGTRIWDQQSKFRVKLGPLKFENFQAFLPNGSARKALQSIAKLMVGNEFDFDMQLCLMAKQVPGLVLTTRAMRKPMLGWTTWLKTKPFENDDEQLVLGVDG